MSNKHQVGDEWTCTEDFFMEDEHGGERVFTSGEVYEVVDADLVPEDGPSCDLWLMDDEDEPHGMDDALMKQYFKKASGDSAVDAYDRAMGII